MSPAEEVAKRKAQERANNAHRANPEREAQLDQFIVKNPVLHERYLAMNKEELIRKLMLARMERAEMVDRRNGELSQWVYENPDIVAKIEQRNRNAPAENSKRAPISLARTVSQGMHAPRVQP